MTLNRRTFYPYGVVVVVFLSVFFTACTTVRNVPAGRPFVYKTLVHVEGKYTTDEKNSLELQLLQQLDDSLRVRTKTKLLKDVIEAPVVYDSVYADKSILFMRALLNSLGYFRDSVRYTATVKPEGDNGAQLRTTVDFYVIPGAVTRLDSIGYALNADTALKSPSQRRALDALQKITQDAFGETTVKKGEAFSKYKLSGERDRLANLYRNNGYLRFSEEELLVLWDTVGIELLRPTLDPIEEVQLLQRRAERLRNPVADVEFRLRDNPDTGRTVRYHVGNVIVYPDYTSDTASRYAYDTTVASYRLRYNKPLFKPHIFSDYIFLAPGDLYRQVNTFKTQTKFNALSAWGLVSIEERPRPGQDTADFFIRLTPARKFRLNTNAEVSYNRGNITIAQGNLLGVAYNVSLQNRNFAKASNQGITNFRFGIELNATLRDFIQTRQLSLGHTVQIPRLVPRWMRTFNRHKENQVSSALALNGSLTSRRDYFDLTTLNASWGYQFGWRNKTLSIRWPNVEYNYLRRGDSLQALTARNRSYQYIFNTGFIVSALANFKVSGGNQRHTSLLTLTGELSGLFGFLRRPFNDSLYRFAKVDAEYTQTYRRGKNAFAWRVYGGAGLSMAFSRLDSINLYLPFFRSYFAGGPNSMRAWAVRRLGPGSTIRSFAPDADRDRFGDIRLEANVEYRFFLTTVGGPTGPSLNTALFADVGNVWFLRGNQFFPDGSFPTSLEKLWQDIAIGVGTGLRIDFGFLKVRLDYAYKAKDPSPDLSRREAQNRWFYGWKPFGGQVQLGVDYPF